MFRMTRECFSQLCFSVIASVGELELKSKSYIDAFLVNKDPMHMDHEKTSREYISGETKLVIILRLLAVDVIYVLYLISIPSIII